MKNDHSAAIVVWRYDVLSRDGDLARPGVINQLQTDRQTAPGIWRFRREELRLRLKQNAMHVHYYTEVGRQKGISV